MKKLLLVVMTFIILLFAACTDAHVSYQLDEANHIQIDYTLNVSTDDRDTENYIDAIEDYWSESGFETDVSQEDGKSTLVGQKTTVCISRQDAADEFAALMTDSDSLFYDVSFNYEPDLREDHYQLEASISLEDIIRQSEAQNVPPNEIARFLDEVNSGTYQLSLSLPGEVESTNADETNDNVCTWYLQYGEVTKLSLETLLINEENIAKYEGLEDDLNRDQTLIIVCGAAGAVIIIAIIIMLIIRRRRVS